MSYKSEIFDQLQFLFKVTGFNDHQLHCVMQFKSSPDAAILKNAVISSISAFPILGTRYVTGNHKPYWENINPEKFTEAFVLAQTTEEFDNFVTYRVDESSGPQVKVCLLRSGSYKVSITINHMICDAAGFKEYLYLLCRTYSMLNEDPHYKPEVINGDRSLRRVISRSGFVTRLTSLLSQKNENNDSGDHKFPFGNGGEEEPLILTRKIGVKHTSAIKDYCKSHGATINDAVLAAYYRALFRKLFMNDGEELVVPVMINMRRFLDEKERFTALTNLTSTVATKLNYNPDEKFSGTLERIKIVMNAKKDKNLGLNGFFKLNLLFKIFPHNKAYRLLKSGLKNPFICMTNIGILDSDRLSFAGIQPVNAFMCGSIKFKPHFQLAISTYNDELTLSTNLYGSAEDKLQILSFLEDVERELPGGSF